MSSLVEMGSSGTLHLSRIMHYASRRSRCPWHEIATLIYINAKCEMRNANAIKPSLLWGIVYRYFRYVFSGRGVQWFLPVDEVEVRVEVVGIAHQLRTHFIHVFLGVLV